MKKRKKIIVLKIGTKSLITKKGRVRRSIMNNIAEDCSAVTKLGWRVVIVTSGAIGFGKKNCSEEVKRKIMKYNVIEQNQCFAMMGQDQLLNAWRSAFAKVKKTVGQVLYTNDMLRGKCKTDITKGLLNLINVGVIPIINENDAVTTEEIRHLNGFGDNDFLGALVTEALKAKYYVNLSTVPFVFCPVTGKALTLITASERKVQKNLKIFAGDSNGGMPSKLKNAKFATRKGAISVITKYNFKKVLSRIIEGERVGTFVVDK